MDQVKTIILTYLDTRSVRGTARRLRVSKNTVKEYIRRGLRYNTDLSRILELSDSELIDIFYIQDGKDLSPREKHFKEKVSYWIKELRRVGVTRHLLWEEYKDESPDGYGYSQFCERLKTEIGRKDLTLNLYHEAGEVMQVDFAGKKMSWVDVGSGEVHKCEVLVVVMPHSQYTFAMALASQKVGDFIHGLNQALLYFGKLPKVILSDNLKSFVIKADKYDPHFNDLCVQLAAHYQVDLKATRVRKPKDKASVENMVGTIYTRVYAPLRDDVFHSIEELNQGIRNQLEQHNAKPYQNKPGNRKSVFEDYELPRMKNLPPDLFEIKKSTKSKVRRDYHVYIGEEKNYYSVPFQYAGRDTIVVYTSTIVEVYLDNQRIAIHERLPCSNTYFHKTNAEHMPRSHSEWKKARGYNAAYFLSLADQIGPATRWAIQHILISRIHEAQSYNSCKGVFELGKKYSPQRLEQTALKCQKVQKASYSMMKRILSGNLDQVSEQLDLFTMPKHENIRGPQAYQ